MARTKQTARRSNGGKAQGRVSITDPGKLKIRIPAQTVRAHVDVSSPHEVKNDFCVLCRDGSENLVIFTCDECPRVICTRCIDVPSNYIEELKKMDVKFRCVLCHTALMKKLNDQTPYYASILTSYPQSFTHYILQGFFRNAQPVLPFFLPVRVQLETSKRSEISASHILIIHFKLVDHVTTGSPVDIIHQFLAPYFPYGGLRKLDVVFDLGTSSKVKGYNEQCMELAKDVVEQDHYKSVCIVITTHTDDDRGDPFIGRKKGDKSGYVSASVPEFLNVLFKPWQDAITRAKDTTMFFMGCGAIVNNTESFRDLRLSVLNSKLSSAIAFTAPHFQPSFTCHLVVAFAEHVLIEGFPLREAFPEILGHSYRLGMHTDIILMTRSETNGAATLQCTRYAWSHATARPWGSLLPLQCPQCGCITKWNFSRDSNKSIFVCSYKDCGRGRGTKNLPPKRYILQCPEGAKRLIPGKRHNAGWLEVPLDFSQPNKVTKFSDM
ncbi:hypothetical protein C8R48DRAFT_782046 [Suillus tomentosus]|nr:hypothetical protein C8R48DRAFT_782046 [Suillus tomentosus]